MDANATTQEHGWIEATIDIEVGNPGDPGYEIHHVRSGYLQTIADFCAWAAQAYSRAFSTALRRICAVIRRLHSLAAAGRPMVMSTEMMAVTSMDLYMETP